MWKSKTNWIYYFSIFLLITLSCKTQKKVQRTVIESSASELLYTTFNVPRATFTFVQGGNSVNVNGSVRIHKDSIIILSLQAPLLGVEVGRVGITQHSLTLIDRINRQYFELNFDSLRNEHGINLNYNIFQSIFTNSLFIYDNPNEVLISDFKEVRIENFLLLQTNRGGVNQEFNVNEDKRILSGRIFANDDEPFSIEWSYMRFESLQDGYNFPHLVKMTISDGDRRFQMDIAYNKVELDKKLNFAFSIPSSYKEVSLDDLLKMLQ